MAARITTSCHSSGTDRVRTHSRQLLVVSFSIEVQVDRALDSSASSGPKNRATSCSRRTTRSARMCETAPLVVTRSVVSEQR